MNFPLNRVSTLVTGFCAGWFASHFPVAVADDHAVASLSQRPFFVSMDEIRKNFVFGDEFRGHYEKSVTLSDGSTRHIKLTPILHEGKEVIELNDNGGVTYMGLDGTTTNGTLMVQLRDADALRARLRPQGFESLSH